MIRELSTAEKISKDILEKYYTDYCQKENLPKHIIEINDRGGTSQYDFSLKSEDGLIAAIEVTTATNQFSVLF